MAGYYVDPWDKYLAGQALLGNSLDDIKRGRIADREMKRQDIQDERAAEQWSIQKQASELALREKQRYNDQINEVTGLMGATKGQTNFIPDGSTPAPPQGLGAAAPSPFENNGPPQPTMGAPVGMTSNTVQRPLTLPEKSQVAMEYAASHPTVAEPLMKMVDITDKVEQRGITMLNTVLDVAAKARAAGIDPKEYVGQVMKMQGMDPRILDTVKEVTPTTIVTQAGGKEVFSTKLPNGTWQVQIKDDAKEPITDFGLFVSEYKKAHNGSTDGLSDAWDAKLKKRDESKRMTIVNNPMPAKLTINDINPESSDALATAMVQGQMPPSLLSKRGQMQQQIYPKVFAMYPKFDVGKAEANYKYMTNQGNLRAISLVAAAQPRLAALADQFAKVNPSNWQTANKVMNAINIEFGKPELTTFQANRNAIVQEINSALAGTSTQSDMRIKLELENLKSASSMAQMMGALNNLNEALISRTEASTAVPYPWAVVRGEKSLEQWRKEESAQMRGSIGGKAQSSPAPYAMPTINGKKVTRTGNGGTVFQLEDGSVVDKNGKAVK